MTESLRIYIEGEILPRYDRFDAAHGRDHAEAVIRRSMELAAGLEVRAEMVYAVAAYHDTGLAEGRADHHLTSGRIVRGDVRLRAWFTAEEIETMACAVEDHRASSERAPRTVYGRIVAEADRLIDPGTIIRRTVQYGLDHYPELNREGHWRRMVDHLHEKYAEGGYLRLWFADSPNAARLETLRALIRDERQLRRQFDTLFDRLTDPRILLEWPLERLWERFPVVLEPHRTRWRTWFAEESALLGARLPDGTTLHHIGSTSVPGLCAKPIVDILAELPRNIAPGSCKPVLERCGYLCMADAGDRMSFNKGYTPQGYAGRVFHLHLRRAGDHDEVFFADYLRRHPDVARAYGTLKRDLAARYRHNRDAYTAAKSDFVARYTRKAKESWSA